MSPTAGYSGTPLPKKLGIKDESTLLVLGAPPGFAERELPDLPSATTNDVVVSFHTARADLERAVPALLAALDVDGGLWICWPKKASKVPTDITEDTVREVFLPLHLVDNKVCAVDDVWSGLRVVWRKEMRATRRAFLATPPG
jgi:hypothetical protein